ncbi:MAG: YjjG family noncanonical pyrimidine nucleotidase [Cytophagales bacterium]|nr:YjjG family noncanonical pyrimidine nucleotidase [Bernardetiaceae bacterium]MDW8205487.1 YjjG family noncanonical pyrimidine nucleotidase [Cytophagales bacterium]
MPAYTHLFFDLDHTLWDFERNSNETLTDLYEAYCLYERGGFSVSDFLFAFREVNRQLWELYNRNQIDQQTLREQRFIRIWKYLGASGMPPSQLGADYLAICPTKPHLLPHARETLDYLAGRYRLHIITNGFDDVQQTKIRSANIAHYFEALITSQNSGYKKPHPAIFDYALAQTGAAPHNSVMIGDNLETDISGARALGLDAIFYNPERIAHQSEATIEIYCLSELQQIL